MLFLRKTIIILLFLLMAIVLFISQTSPQSAGSAVERRWLRLSEFRSGGYKVVELQETPEAFPNPMKGFRAIGGGGGPGSLNLNFHEYSIVYKHYIKYTDLEATAEDTVQKIIDWSNREWAGIEKKNIKIIPLIIMSFIDGWEQADSRHPDHNFWPNDIPQPSLVERWYTPQLHERFERFVMKLGEAWDNDPRVAAVQIGLWGFWGEQHLLLLVDNNFEKGIIPLSMQKTLGDAFTKAFKNKKLFIRYPETFMDYNFGFTWDYFAHPVEHRRGATQQMIRRNDWKNNMFIGEVAYDKEALSNQGARGSLYGNNPDETLSNNRYTDHVINYIKRFYASNLTWIDKYTHGNPAIKANAARIQKLLGYRYVIRSAVYKETVSNGEEVKFGFEVSNIGSAPFYYNWQVEVSLLDQNRNPVYKKNLNIDIRTWLPGETKTIIDSITIPNNLRNGTYFLAVAILDPAGNLPSLRFANTNYYNGGRTPIGIVGVNREPEGNFGKFDFLRTDRSLQYIVGNASPSNRIINREQSMLCTFDNWQANYGNGSILNIITGSEMIDGNNFTTYTITGNHNVGYAQAITSGNAATVNNLRMMRAFSFIVLGDGNDYKVSLQTSDTWTAAANWDNYHTVIPTVNGELINIIVYVDTLVQAGWGRPVRFIQSNAQSIQFEPVYNNAGQFNLKVWDLRTYQ